MSAGNGRTIERRIRISRRDGGSARCSGSRVRVRRRNFSPHTPPSTTPLTLNAISPRPKRITCFALRLWTRGGRRSQRPDCSLRRQTFALAHPASILTSLALDLWLDRGAAACFIAIVILAKRRLACRQHHHLRALRKLGAKVLGFAVRFLGVPLSCSVHWIAAGGARRHSKTSGLDEQLRTAIERLAARRPILQCI